ncbi:MAG: VTT domain-containing protein [candidate division KSB1 bacterium]|nr:VTT domain-containing protein [candidate division KSB1 bacterium]MDZ7378573.1 VTT domain-containing protein [candidate division KSB1 bacterium]MDZ7393757.1 VTT domain-containing protein [candidate division KSB1 bacterium]MDZ7413751.1 VTT domain-containing protein [candidate division KSB1 bacterium]
MQDGEQSTVEIVRPREVGVRGSANPIRRLYDWVLRWAQTPYGWLALVLLAFAESSFFPVPPDVLLIALALALPRRAFLYAGSATVASVVGGIGGYGIGLGLMEAIGWRIVHFYHAEELFRRLFATFNEYSFWAVLSAALTPIPYKIFTISAGAAGSPFLSFVLASVIGRGVRFFAVSTLLYIWGPKVRELIDKYFNIATVVFVVLLLGGFLLLKYLL